MGLRGSGTVVVAGSMGRSWARLTGAAAARENVSRDKNPYYKELRVWWEAGWDQAKKLQCAEHPIA